MDLDLARRCAAPLKGRPCEQQAPFRAGERFALEVLPTRGKGAL